MKIIRKCCLFPDTPVSGSPIIQNGKLLSAVTHVFVQASTKGHEMFDRWQYCCAKTQRELEISCLCLANYRSTDVKRKGKVKSKVVHSSVPSINALFREAENVILRITKFPIL